MTGFKIQEWKPIGVPPNEIYRCCFDLGGGLDIGGSPYRASALHNLTGFCHAGLSQAEGAGRHVFFYCEFIGAEAGFIGAAY
jgi:hypothetical protein